MTTESPTSNRASGSVQRMVRRTEFVIHIPPLKPNQPVWTRAIQVPVRIEDGEEILTVEAHELIDRIKTQMTLVRLIDVVRELTGASAPNSVLGRTSAKANCATCDDKAT